MSDSPQQSQPQQGRGQRGGQQKRNDQQGGGTERPHVLDDETIIVETRPSWTVWFGQLVGAVLILLAGLLVGGQAGSGVVVVIPILLSLFIFGWIWYRRKRIRYVITDRRAMIVTGISSKKTTEIWLRDARSMQTGSTFFERLLGHGTIILSDSTLTRNSLNALGALPFLSALPIFNTGRGLTFAGISNPVRVANVIRKRQSALKSVRDD
ncbi:MULTISPECIES: PH domain-containing protein [unclassified Halorhabdus]|uniref:PH domain-containing protein n=1 Tax=unclassified Halorhabdus TaxID=2621901 RepID=UPI0023DB5F58|nr:MULTISPECIES: PH domain-containing protein [unclassified Halorhabdus]WEL16256.1 putative membrane protein, contains bPH2 domain [Halorhabdus sp. SVX81]WEL20149.1 putative membrane protein, contains bPH2 domain [Halorhabdus sp. BNX81]